MSRPSFLEVMHSIAFTWAERATCERMQAGVVAFNARYQVLAAGYNGALKGEPHCTDDGEGCLIDDVTGRCVTGDTVISKFQGGRYNSKHRTIREIHDLWHWDKRSQNFMRKMVIRAVNDQGAIVPDRITDVWRTGTKAVIKIVTSLGRSVTATPSHRFLTPEGWHEIGSMCIGDRVALNGQPMQMFGGWNRGIVGTASHSYKGRNVTAGSARERAHRYAIGTHCVSCGSTTGLQVHHRDLDVRNDSFDNLWTLCVGCHNVAHTPHAKRERVLFDTIVSVEPAGEQIVYDITTERYHNFIGNGFALHNCIRTVHAEQNMIAQAARLGIQLDGMRTYSTARPCEACTKLLIQSGISELYYYYPYPSDSEERVNKMLQRAGVAVHGPLVERGELQMLGRQHSTLEAS